MRPFLPAEIGVREPWGSLPPTAAPTAAPGHHPGSAPARALICRSNKLLLPELRRWVCLPVLFFRFFPPAGEKHPWLDFFWSTPGQGQSNPGVHLSTFSLPLPGSPHYIKTKTCDFMLQRGGDCSIWWTSLTHKCPREELEGEWCQPKHSSRDSKAVPFLIALHKPGFGEAVATLKTKTLNNCRLLSPALPIVQSTPYRFPHKWVLWAILFNFNDRDSKKGPPGASTQV